MQRHNKMVKQKTTTSVVLFLSFIANVAELYFFNHQYILQLTIGSFNMLSLTINFSLKEPLFLDFFAVLSEYEL